MVSEVMERHKIIPFYMAYPIPTEYQSLFSAEGNDNRQRYPFEVIRNEESDQAQRMQRDLEYLQQLYPARVRKYRGNVTSALDAIDYEGSLIYDELPDRWRIYKLSSDITERIIMEENSDREQNEELPLHDNEKEWLSELVQMMVFLEIYTRRHRQKRDELL